MNFSGTAAAASGYNIATYLWEQIDDSNIAVTINNDDQLNASFTAPYVPLPTLLSFKLTVTDDQAQISTDTVTITVNPDTDAPSVHITFPTPEGIYNPIDNGNTLAIFGQATPKAGSTISRITIKGVTPEVTATINAQEWRASSLAIPSGISEITLIVEAEDSLGRISHKNLHLSVSESYEPPYTNESSAILWDDALNKLWILGTGFLTRDTQIVPVDPRTGARGSSVLTTALAANKMIFNADKSAFLISGAINNQPGKIHSVNKSTGVVTVLSGAEQGLGPDLRTGSAGLALNGNDLYLAENISNGFSGLMRVNLTTGNREILLEAEDSGSLTYALADIAYHNDEVIMVKNSFRDSRVYGYNPTTQSNRQINTANSGLDGSGKIIMSNGDVLGVSQDKSLMRVNIATGVVSTVSNKLRSTGGTGYKYLTYDESNGLFYTVYRRQIISVIDEVSGHIVDLPRQ